MINVALIFIFLFFIVLTTVNLIKLKSFLKYLPSVNNHQLRDTSVENRSITDYIDRPELSKNNITVFLLMSPTCEMCHAKITSIIKSKKIRKEKYLFYADSSNKEQFNQMSVTYKEVKINPLTVDQILNLNKGIFPFFLEVEPNGRIVRAYIA